MHSAPNLLLQRQLPGFAQDLNLVFHLGNLVPITWMFLCNIRLRPPSKEAKSIAQTAMGVSLPFVRNQA